MTMIHTADINGRPWAKLSELKEKAVVELDDGFICASAGKYTVAKDDKGFYIWCKDGHHYLASHQAGDGEHLIGIYGPM